MSSHWPEDSVELTCPHPQSLTSWTQKWPFHDLACLSRSVSRGPGCYPNNSLNLCFFSFLTDIPMDYLSVTVNLLSFRYTVDMAGNSAHYSSLSQWVRKSRHGVKHRPLAGAEMTAQRTRPSWPPASAMRFILETKSPYALHLLEENVDIWNCPAANKWWCITLYNVCLMDYSAYIPNALSRDVAPTADLIYCKVPCIVKKTISDSVTTSQLSLSCRKGPCTKEAVNCKSSCCLSLLSSNLIMWSIISAATALHPSLEKNPTEDYY